MTLQACSKCSLTESLISQMEANSGVTFYEAQIALARQWEGPRYTGDDAPKEVFIKVPQPAQEGMALSQTKMKLQKVALPASYDDAVNIVRRFEEGSDDIRGDEDVSDSVSQHRLLDRTRLSDEIWYGSEAEERDAYVYCCMSLVHTANFIEKIRIGASLHSLEGYDR
jgi:phospholipase D1/2